jgi:hypothetical protein
MATFILKEKTENGTNPHIYAETETDLGVLANYLLKSGVLSKPVTLRIVENGNGKWGYDCAVGEESDCLTLFREARKIDGGLLAYKVRFVCHPELMEEIAIGIANGVDGFGKVASYSFRFTLATEDDCGAFVSFTAWNKNEKPVTVYHICEVEKFMNIARKDKGLPLVHILALDEEGAEIVEFKD